MKKTLKPKTRHLLIETNSKFTEKEYFDIIRNQYIQFYGIMGLSHLNLKTSLTNKKLIVSCNHTEKEKLIFTLATINKINNAPVYFRTKKVSGTINSFFD